MYIYLAIHTETLIDSYSFWWRGFLCQYVGLDSTRHAVLVHLRVDKCGRYGRTLAALVVNSRLDHCHHDWRFLALVQRRFGREKVFGIGGRLRLARVRRIVG